MFVGLDVGKEWTVGVWKDAGGNKVREDRFPTRDVGLSALASGLDASSSIAVEASTHGIFVRDFLAYRGLRVELANPLAVKWIYASDKKTDKADGEIPEFSLVFIHNIKCLQELFLFGFKRNVQTPFVFT